MLFLIVSHDEIQFIPDGWSRSQKILDGGAGARNLVSRSTDIVCGAASKLYK